MKIHWETDGHTHRDDFRAVYVIVEKPNCVFPERIDCPNEIFSNSKRIRWAKQKVKELKERFTYGRGGNNENI